MPTPTRSLRAIPAVIVSLASLPCAAQPAPPPTTAKDVLLTTMTPLGEAVIVRPAGSEVTEPIGEDGKVVLRQGPFTARLDRADLVFPAPVAATSPAPTTSVVVEARSAARDLPEHAVWQEDWRTLVPTGIAVLLGIYSVITTVALLRRRNRWDE